jgi:heptosyltransferase-2
MQRILAIRNGAIGDIILTLPALGAVRQAFPHAIVDLMGNPSRLVFARHSAYADALLDMAHWDLYRLFSQGARVSERLAAYLRSCEMILAYVPLSDDTFAQRLRTCCAGQVIVWSPHPPPDVHASEHLLRPVAPFLSSSYNPCPHIALDPEAVTAAEQFWCQANLPERGVIAVHPGSGGTHKLWPLAGWRQVLTWVARQRLPCVIISGPAEGDRVAELLQDVPSYPWVCAAQLPLPHLAALLARCQVVVGHDSGITHLAAAVGTTPLALFGPTDPLVWGPRSRRSCVLWPQPPAPLTLEALPAARVIEVLTALYDGTFPFVPSRVDCTILRLAAR